MTDLISVIVTTHDREDALDAVLRALSRQTDRRFEVVVADDGSGPSTAALVETWRLKLGAPLVRVWQEHRGFRAAAIRNRAVVASRGAYCIFLDGDCIPRPTFVAVHRRLAERGWFVAGSHVLMSEMLTEFALQRGQEPELWALTTWAGMRSYRALNRIMPMVRLPLGPMRKLHPRQWDHARACNLGIWRSDFDRVDGFDAAFTGWGGEDSELLIRLLHAGVRRKSGNFATCVLHLWHPPADRSAMEDNRDRLIDTLRGRRLVATVGLTASCETGAPAPAEHALLPSKGRD